MKKRDLTDELIEEGIKSILETGVEGFSIRAVAETCHVSCAAPFKHFKGRANYFTQMSERLDEMLLKRMQKIELQYSKDYKQAHIQMGTEYINFLIEYPFLINSSFWRIINIEWAIGIRKWKSFQIMIEQFRKYCDEKKITEEIRTRYYFSFQTFAYGTIFAVTSRLSSIVEEELVEQIKENHYRIYADMEREAMIKSVN